MVGYGLCHGTAGNAYAFLALFKATHKEEYLYKAIKVTQCTRIKQQLNV